MIEALQNFQWELFIIAEVISFGALIAFGLMRYLFDKRLLSTIFIFLFIGINIFEASIAWYLYQYTGEIGDFQIIITIFILYACTFGISDFKKNWTVRCGNGLENGEENSFYHKKK